MKQRLLKIWRWTGKDALIRWLQLLAIVMITIALVLIKTDYIALKSDVQRLSTQVSMIGATPTPDISTPLKYEGQMITVKPGQGFGYWFSDEERWAEFRLVSLNPLNITYPSGFSQGEPYDQGFKVNQPGPSIQVWFNIVPGEIDVRSYYGGLRVRE